MKTLATTASVLALTTTSALAGGLDRSGQSVGIIFQEGNYAEIAIGTTDPSVTGVDIATTGSTGNVADGFDSISGAIKLQVNEKLSFSVILEEPYGSDIDYPELATSALLGGTQARASTQSTTFVARYKFNPNFSVHGGLRNQTISGNVTLNGAAYGGPPIPPTPGVSGYNVALGKDTAWGYLVGVAYERPEIALRVALTYNSEITHDLPTTETVAITGLGTLPFVSGTTSNTSLTEVKSPQSVNLEFQTGVAEDTLVFGSIRWAQWSAFKIDPANFVNATNGGLVDLDDSVTYTLGVGRRFNDKWSGSASMTYEAQGDDKLVSPLAPTDGLFAIALGARYQATESMSISGGMRYNWLGNASPETGTPDVARATMTDNTALSMGLRIGFQF